MKLKWLVVFIISIFLINFSEILVFSNTLLPVVEIVDIDDNIVTIDSVGKAFYFKASSPNGISKMEYKTPNSNVWLEYNEGFIFDENSINGKYYFRAYDTLGNVNQCHIFLDTIKPIGHIFSYDAELSSGDSVEEEFIYFQASDELSGVKAAYVLTPSSSKYIEYTDYTYLYESGTYYFYVVDFVGNVSPTYNITLNAKPMVNIIYNENENSVFLTWDKNDYLVYVNEEKYSKNSVFYEEGEYNVLIINGQGRTGTDTFYIDHKYDFINLVNATCLNDGYELYRCITCKDELKIKYSERTGHSMIEEIRKLTCTQNGGVYRVCQKCDYEEEVDIEKATGHNYNCEIIKNATCTNKGIRNFSCSNCLEVYQVEIDILQHNYILIDEKIKKDGLLITKELTYKCHNCSNTIIEYKNINNNLTGDLNFSIVSNLKYLVIILTILSTFWSIYMGVKIFTSRNKNEKIEAKKFVLNYIIGLIVIFIIIMAVPFIIRGISSIL